MLKIELDEKDGEVAIPPELRVLREVTGEPEYKDAVLAVDHREEL